MTSLERIADTFFPEPKKADYTTYGRIVSVNNDGSYQVQVNASATTTRCAKLCNASVGDSVLVLIQSNGHAAAVGRVGGDEGGGGGGGDTPTGAITMFGGSTAPEGWLLCDGSAVSRTTYSALFSIIGTTYGTGDGSSTFNLPDLGGKFALGKSSTHALATTGGVETVTLTAAQSGVPAHSHGLNSHTHTYDKASTPTGSTTLTTNQIPAHTHGSKSLTGTFRAYGDTGSIGLGGDGSIMAAGIVSTDGTFDWAPGYEHRTGYGVKINATHEHTSVGGGQGHTHTVSTSSTNTGQASGSTANNTASAATAAHNNMPPYLTINYIIKA